MNKIIAMICFGLLLSGCSNYLESSEIGVVIGMGIDYEKKSKKYEVTFQVVNPRGVTSSSVGTQGLPIMQLEGKGRTLSEAARNSSKSFSRQIIYSHLALIVISEELAREKGLNFILDTFERDAKVRTNIPIIVAKEQSANNVLGNLPIADRIPSISLVKKIAHTSTMLGENVDVKVFDTIAALSSKGQEPVINGMKIVGDIEKGASKKNEETLENTVVHLAGLAVFHNGYLVDWLEGNKSKSVQILRNEMKNTNISLPCLNKKGHVSINVKYIDSKANVTYQNRKEKAKIKIEVEGAGYLDELLCNLAYDKSEVLKEIEKELNQKIEKDLSEGIHFAQKAESDIFGFGEMIHRKKPKQWKKIENEWNKEFAAADVEITVNMSIFDTGMMKKAYPF
jgi:spore germination protein KC